ncbi:hypothetical protein [Paenibacillus sp. FSL P4-0288]|uniref:hypothetical protein n=1 Tax=Paenibacillus sp. FSL P4-0288 TaxID=2921633 RepID=UPI0030FA96F8
MGNYRDLEHHLRHAEKAKILILDTGNIQFYFQNRHLIPQSHIFKHYDLILIPGWVHAEYAHHSGKASYIASLPLPYIIIDEIDDYLPMLGYSDKKLMELFRLAAPFSESLKFFNQYKTVEIEDIPDDWIEQYYQDGFYTRTTSSLVTKKNAGEVSILTLCFSLLSHYPTQISNISIASSDFGIIAIKDKLLKEANRAPLELGISTTPPISYLSKDVSLLIAIKDEIIQPHQVAALRPNSCSSIYLEMFPDGSSALHEHVLHTPDFIEMCKNHNRYRMIF